MSELRSAGRPVVVVLSEQLVRQPEATLRAACLALGLPFEPAMLSWQAGPKPYDGVWAPWWYGSTHGATGEGRTECGLHLCERGKVSAVVWRGIERSPQVGDLLHEVTPQALPQVSSSVWPLPPYLLHSCTPLPSPSMCRKCASPPPRPAQASPTVSRTCTLLSLSPFRFLRPRTGRAPSSPSLRSGFSDRVQDVRQPLPDRLKPLLGECQALFRLLKRMAVKPCSGYSGEPSGWFCLVHQGRHCSAY